jgi:signal peptidase I
MLIDNHTFALLKRTIKKDGWLELPAYGNSMFPFIQQGNLCRFIPCQSSQLKKGDVILFYSQTGQLIAHRFVSVRKIDNQLFFLFKGDTNLGYDQLIREEYILGKLASVQKKQLTINPQHILARCWGKMILTFPILSGMLRKFLNRRFKLQF